MKPGTRIQVHACTTPNTYKYFVELTEIHSIWQQLETNFGVIEQIPGFNLLQIDAQPFVLRATKRGNPITVARKRACKSHDLERLHNILRFRPQQPSP